MEYKELIKINKDLANEVERRLYYIRDQKIVGGDKDRIRDKDIQWIIDYCNENEINPNPYLVYYSKEFINVHER